MLLAFGGTMIISIYFSGNKKGGQQALFSIPIKWICYAIVWDLQNL